MGTTERAFLLDNFICDMAKLGPESYLPHNLDIFWIDGILSGKLSEDAAESEISASIIRHACMVLLKDFQEESDHLHEDLYLQELMLEKLERINNKAGVTNTGFAYVPADTDDIFSGPRYSPEHLSMLLKLVAGALEWEKRQDSMPWCAPAHS
jgi:hypothetical protein